MSGVRALPRLGLTLAALLASCALHPLPAQTMDTTVVRVPYDSVGPVTHDTLVTVAVTHDTTYRLTRDSLVITPVPPPPPPPPSAGWTPPAGFTRLTDMAFSAWGVTAGWGAVPGRGTVTLLGNGDGPRSPPGSARVTYGAGYRVGTAPGTTGTTLFRSAGYRELWWTFAFRFSANWVGHTSNVNKMWHIWGQNPDGNHLLVVAHGSGSGPLQLRMRCQGTGEDKQCGTSQAVFGFANLGQSATITRGQWHTVTVRVVMNGALDVWMDGRQTHHYDRVFLGQQSWYHLQWSPTWGGACSPTGCVATDYVPATQTLDLDHVTAAGR